MQCEKKNEKIEYTRNKSLWPVFQIINVGLEIMYCIRVYILLCTYDLRELEKYCTRSQIYNTQPCSYCTKKYKRYI